jgi:hypothetical protein
MKFLVRHVIVCCRFSLLKSNGCTVLMHFVNAVLDKSTVNTTRIYCKYFRFSFNLNFETHIASHWSADGGGLETPQIVVEIQKKKNACNTHTRMQHTPTRTHIAPTRTHTHAHTARTRTHTHAHTTHACTTHHTHTHNTAHTHACEQKK